MAEVKLAAACISDTICSIKSYAVLCGAVLCVPPLNCLSSVAVSSKRVQQQACSDFGKHLRANACTPSEAC